MTQWRFSMPLDAGFFRESDWSALQLRQPDRRNGAANAVLSGDVLKVQSTAADSGYLQLPCSIPAFGNVIVRTSQLMPRDEPYDLLVECARGQITQVRNALAAAESFGGPALPAVSDALRQAIAGLGQAVRAPDRPSNQRSACAALAQALHCGEALTEAFARFRLDVAGAPALRQARRLSCVLDYRTVEAGRQADLFAAVFGNASIPLSWPLFEPTQGEYRWELLERRFDWCTANSVPFTVGPLVDFRRPTLPEWLGNWEGDLTTLITLIIDVVESCVARYGDRVQSWETSARSNSANVLGLKEQQLLWLTRRLLDAARAINPRAEFVITVDQPWADYCAAAGRSHSPLSFIDALVRSDSGPFIVNLEVAMGYAPGGSYCRSLLDLAQLLDEYAAIGLPLRLRLYFPSTTDECSRNGRWAGQWHGPPTAAAQADWAEKAVLVALANPAIERVTWGQFWDGPGGDWPCSGLLDEAGHPKPAFDRLRALRQTILGD